VKQHRLVIEAASSSGISLIAYTSVLHAERSQVTLADDHRQTEAMLADSGVPFVRRFKKMFVALFRRAEIWRTRYDSNV
jgi:uncharacterized protein YbjT (DUF2867 family)